MRTGVVSHFLAKVAALQLRRRVTVHIVLAHVPVLQEDLFPVLRAVHRADALDGAQKKEQ